MRVCALGDVVHYKQNKTETNPAPQVTAGTALERSNDLLAH